jgi:hypothetical protein
MQDERKEFLAKMYDQMFNDINTHILVIWQSVGVLVGSFALLALSEKGLIPIDLAISLVVIIATWLMAHLYDASYWYNRNLVIIANIERQFLKQEDLKNIHYYFGKHRSKAAMLTHLRIQWWLGVIIGALFLAYHFISRVLPGIHEPVSQYEPVRTLPYAVTAVCIPLLMKLRSNREESYAEFRRNSPGIEVDTTGITYGIGHPTDSGTKSAEAAKSDPAKK